MVITVRKYDPATDSGVIEYGSEKTVIKTGSSEITSELTGDRFDASFLPDGFWLACDQTDVIGAILVTVEENDGSDMVQVHDISIDRTYRRQGLGGLLMHKADLYADSKGISRLTGIVPETNEAALTMFRKCWFTDSRTVNGQVTMNKLRRHRERRP